MSYSDPKYDARVMVPVVLGSAVGTLTFTASAHAKTNSAVYRLPKFLKRTKVNAVRVKVGTAPVAGVVSSKLIFKNGTNTFAVATIGTNTAGSTVDATMTSTNAVLAADTEPTVDLLGTGTASETGVAGTFDIYFETQEQFS
jgi:hypothetical protein